MNIHLGDIAKLDDFLEHASFHQEEYGDDWLAFFQKHLGSESEKHLHQEHQEEHEKLPHHDHLCSSVLPVVILEEKGQDLSLSIQVPDQKQSFTYIENYSFLSQIDIFQPPRHA